MLQGEWVTSSWLLHQLPWQQRTCGCSQRVTLILFPWWQCKRYVKRTCTLLTTVVFSQKQCCSLKWTQVGHYISYIFIQLRGQNRGSLCQRWYNLCQQACWPLSRYFTGPLGIFMSSLNNTKTPQQPFAISLCSSLNTREMEHNDWILDKIRAAAEVVSGRILIKKWEDTFSTVSSQQYWLLISANIRTMCPCRWKKCQIVLHLM